MAARGTRKTIMNSDKKSKRSDIFKSLISSVISDVKVIDTREKTYVYVVVIDKKAERNTDIALSCKNCSCVSGYAYDSNKDCVWIRACDSRDLGTVDFSMQITFENTGSWRATIPLPMSALEKMMTPAQAKVVGDLKEKYPSSNFTLHFVQMVSCQ